MMIRICKIFRPKTNPPTLAEVHPLLFYCKRKELRKVWGDGEERGKRLTCNLNFESPPHSPLKNWDILTVFPFPD